MVVKLGLFTHAKNADSTPFNLRNLRRISGITWHDHVTNKDVLLEQVGIPSMYALLTKGRLRWLGHVSRMEDDRISKDVLYGELTIGTRPAGRPLLGFMDVCIRDLRSENIGPLTAQNRGKVSTLESSLPRSGEIRDGRNEGNAGGSDSPTNSNSNTDYGLFSHSRRCHSTQD